MVENAYTSIFLRRTKKREKELSFLARAGGSGGPVFRRKSARALVSLCLCEVDGIVPGLRSTPTFWE